MKQCIPNFFTLLNLFSGSIGIIEAMGGSVAQSVFYIWSGLCFDFLDGFSARKLGVSSQLGKQLDSLADLVTFGLLPSIIMYRLISQSSTPYPYLPYIAFFITIFSTLRLAQFNIDERQRMVFIGLPTPANAIFISTLPFIILFNTSAAIANFVAHPYTLIAIVLISSLLLVAKVKLMAFKFPTYAWQANWLQYLFLLCANLLILFLHSEGIALSIVLYVVLSLLFQKSFC